MKLYKKIVVLATVAAMAVGVFAFSALADNVNYYQNWTNDKGNSTASGR